MKRVPANDEGAVEAGILRHVSEMGPTVLWLVPIVLSLWTASTVGSEVIDDSEGREAHWAFQPLLSTQSIAETVANGDVPMVDGLIDSSLARTGLQPNPRADKYTLIRRVTYDLTGLPPTPEEIDAFVSDSSRDAYVKLVDRLLASPAYGERWGRYWLDLARYADSNGADENHGHPNAWRYRDYVIRAFNQDTPYDQFITEQLAGDLLPKTGDLASDQDQRIATGFLALGPKMLAEQDKGKMLIDVADEQIDVVSKTFMGLTVSCARCHDHKFDPILQEDYFAMAGVFLSTKTMANTNHVSRWVEVTIDSPGNQEIVDEFEAEVARAKEELATLEAEEAVEDGDDRLKQLKARIKKLESEGAPLPKAMSVTEGEVGDVAVHIRGVHTNPRDTTTPRGVNRLLAEHLPSPEIDATRSGRLELAEWLTDPRHPLTARVMVNRLWQGHFGHGLVRTPSNFGLSGEAPSHPELLDWLAREFIASGWSVKHMHRVILSSEAYRRSSVANPANAQVDPENRWLWRQNRQRLEAEPIHDTLLFVASRLEQSHPLPFGPEEKVRGVVPAKEGRFARNSRSVYLPVIRTNGYDLFAAFDGADPSMHHQERVNSVVPSQALFMLNSPLALDAAEDLAGRVADDTRREVEERLDELTLRLFARPARPQELEILSEALGADGAEPSNADWARVCRTLIAANEFIYIN